MRKIAASLFIIVLMTTTVRAQFAYEFGYTMAKMSIKTNGKSLTTAGVHGMNIGILGDIRLDNKVYFEPGLFYEMAGTKLPELKEEYFVNTTNIHLTIEYKNGNKCGARFFAGIGPQIIFNNGGSYISSLKIGPDRFDDLKQRGVGLGGNIGYIPKKHYYFRAHFMTGMSNLKPVGDDKNKIKPSSIGLNIGYFFGRCKSKRESTNFVREKNNHWRGLSKGKYSTRPRYPRY